MKDGIPSYPPSHPSLSPPPGQLPWSAVVGRRENKGVGNPGKRKEGKPTGGTGAPPAGQGGGVGNRRKLPATAAITITAKTGGYGDIIKIARKTLGENGTWG